MQRGVEGVLLDAELDAGDLIEILEQENVAWTRFSPLDDLLECAGLLPRHPFLCVVLAADASSAAAANTAGMRCIGIGCKGTLAREHIASIKVIDSQALISTGWSSMPPAEPWKLSETHYQPGRDRYWRSCFTVANGYLGITGNQEERYPGARPGTFVAGVCESRPLDMLYHPPSTPHTLQAVVNQIDWCRVVCTVDGAVFNLHSGRVEAYGGPSGGRPTTSLSTDQSRTSRQTASPRPPTT